MDFDQKKYWLIYDENPEKGFRFLYDHFHKIIIGYCIKNGQENEDAIEVAQEVFCKFWSHSNSISLDQNIQAYLFSIAKNIIRDKFRKLVRDKAAKEYQYYFLKMVEGDQNEVFYNELNNEITRTFDSMPELRKLVFQLSRFRGYSNKEISNELGISIKTVEGHISKALKTFRRELQDYKALLIIMLPFVN